VPQPTSSVASELLWLLLFLAIFAVLTYAMLAFVVPHHFNDRIAVMIAALVSGVVWLGLRAWRKR
jgi:hypothetical protein